jgi:uncharacterized repeat protein (TIGR03943 family)
MRPSLGRALSPVAARLDGAAMCALAGFMGWLAAYGDYWMYLNPKFKPVTLAAACVLGVLGVYAVRRPVSRPSVGRSLCWLALLAMIALTEGGVQILSRNLDSDPFYVAPTLPAPEATLPVPDRMTALGKSYIPINTGELYDIAAKGRGESFEKPYAMRGFVSRDPDLDAQNEFVLYRLAVWCCFADSTAVGFRVKLPQGATLPPDKAWMVVFGHLVDAPAGEQRAYVLPGMAFSSVAPATRFAADHLEAAAVVPEQVTMFEWREAEPYAY